MRRADSWATIAGYILVLVAFIYFAGHVGISILR